MKHSILLATLLLAGCASTPPAEKHTAEPPVAEQSVADLPLVGPFWVLELIETPAYRVDLTEALEPWYDSFGDSTSPQYPPPAYLYFSDTPTWPDILNYEHAPENSWQLPIGLSCGSGAGWYSFGSEPIIYLSRVG